MAYLSKPAGLVCKRSERQAALKTEELASLPLADVIRPSHASHPMRRSDVARSAPQRPFRALPAAILQH